VKTSFATVSSVSKIPVGKPIAYAVGMMTHGRNMEDTAPEAYIARTPFGETEFKLDLSIFNPSTGTSLSRLDAIGTLIFVIDDRPKK
jgi:hypothetical protein